LDFAAKHLTDDLLGWRDAYAQGEQSIQQQKVLVMVTTGPSATQQHRKGSHTPNLQAVGGVPMGMTKQVN
jgi:hypothetical protein